MFKKSDYVILSLICFFLGVFLVSQIYAGKEYKRILQPENNEVIVLEVTKLTKSNADLRREVQDLTNDLNIYRGSQEQKKTNAEKYAADIERFQMIDGELSVSGQGAIIKVSGRLSAAQVVDLVNAIKNIGVEVLSINDKRILLNTNLAQFSGLSELEIKMIGNSSLLKSAIERRGGIVEQLSSKSVSISVLSSDEISVGAGNISGLRYANIVSGN